jgi:hypothetical protein
MPGAGSGPVPSPEEWNLEPRGPRCGNRGPSGLLCRREAGHAGEHAASSQGSSSVYLTTWGLDLPPPHMCGPNGLGAGWLVLPRLLEHDSGLRETRERVAEALDAIGGWIRDHADVVRGDGLDISATELATGADEIERFAEKVRP